MAPIVTAPATASICEGVLLTFTVLASDPDGDAIASLTATGLPSGATFTANPTNTAGTFAWTPSFTQSGTYGVTFVASNALSGSATTAITLNSCNRTPVVTAPASVFGTEGLLLTFTVLASDPDGSTIFSLTATGSAITAGASFTANVTRTSGTFFWTPNFTQAGTYNVTFTATNELSGSATTSITVNDVDRAPVATAPATASGPAGTLITFMVTASDPDGQAITSLTASGLPSGATFTANATFTSGTFSWTPSFTQVGSYSVTFTASNALSGSATTVITTGQCFGYPIVTAPATVSGDEGALLTFTVSAAERCSTPITSLTASGLPPGATFTANATNTSGTFRWTPSLSQSGSYSVTFTATGGSFWASSATTSITVNNVGSPVVMAPATASGDEGTLVSFTVSASDPDGDTLTLTALGLPLGATFTANASGTSGTFSWTPSYSQAGAYSVTFRASDGTGGIANATTSIMVTNVDRAPTADAGPDRTVVVSSPVSWDGSGSTDPDGDVLTYAWDFGDGTTGSGAMASHTYTATGTYTVTLTVMANGLTDTDTATVMVVNESSATAFTAGGNNTTSLGAGKPYTCVQIQSDGSYTNSDVNLATIKMQYPGSTVTEIFADAGKTTISGDKNGDGITEITACFRKADLRLLFSGLPSGPNTVTVDLRGDLITGGGFHATLTMVVKGTGGALAASISPNPLNPKASLTFVTSRPGAIRIQMFDPQGRLVKTVADGTIVGAGYHDLSIDGMDANGTKLASGVYFVKVWSQYDGQEVKSITILK